MRVAKNIVPGPRGIGALRAYRLMRQNRLQFLTFMKERYGDLSCLRIAGRSLYIVGGTLGARDVLISHQDDYKKGPGIAEAENYFGNGLLTAQGAEWIKQREAISEFISKINLESVVASVNLRFETLQKGIENSGTHPLNVTAIVANVVCYVMQRHILAREIDAIELRRHLASIEKLAMRKTIAAFPQFVLPRADYYRSYAYLKSQALCIVESVDKHESKSSLMAHLFQSGKFAKAELEYQARTFLLAAQDNTVAAILWTILMLSAQESWQQRLRDEIKTTCVDAPLGVAHLRKMATVRAVVLEAMRLYPPVWAITRQAIKDTEIDGQCVGRGSDIIVSPFLIHRDETMWPRATEFLPERVHEGEAGRNGQRLFLPFGYGSRRCVASEFALIETMATVANFFLRYTVVGSECPEFRPYAGFSLRPDRDITTRVRPVG